MLRLFVSLLALWVSLDEWTIQFNWSFLRLVQFQREKMRYLLPCLGLGNRASVLKIRFHRFA